MAPRQVKRKERTPDDNDGHRESSVDANPRSFRFRCSTCSKSADQPPLGEECASLAAALVQSWTACALQWVEPPEGMGIDTQLHADTGGFLPDVYEDAYVQRYACKGVYARV